MKVDVNLQDIKESLFRVEMLGWSYASRAQERFYELTEANRAAKRSVNPSEKKNSSHSTNQKVNPSESEVSIYPTNQNYNPSTSNAQELLPANGAVNRDVDFYDDERGDVPGWVLVVLMTTGLVTAIWTIAAPRLSAILKNSLEAMNGIR